MVLLLSDAKSPACLSCIHFWAILTKDLIDYSCLVMGCPFILRVYKNTIEGQVGLHCHRYTVMLVGSSKSPRDTLYVEYGDHDGGLLLLLISIFLFLGFLDVLLHLSNCCQPFLKVQLGYPHFPKPWFTCSNSALASIGYVTILSHLSYKVLMTPNLCWRG